MTKEERQSAILDQLLKQGSVLVSALSDNLQVSAVTIRKDLTDLERQGRLYRSHGGHSDQSVHGQPFREREGKALSRGEI